METDPRRAVLAVLLVAASLTDLRWGRIYNWMTYPAVLLGVGMAAVMGGWPGAQGALGGAAAAFIPFFLVMAIGGMAGGDVKLMTAVGALLSWPAVISALFHAIFAGGFLAIASMLWTGTLVRGLRNAFVATVTHVFPGLQPVPLDPANSNKVPYGLAISLGTVWSLWEGTSLPWE